MIYISFIFLLLFLIYFYDYKDIRQYKTEWVVFVLLILILIGGIRFNTGGDSANYLHDYADMPSLLDYFTFNFDSTRYGKGFIFLNSITKTFSDDFLLFQIVHSSIVNIIITWFFLKYTKHIFFAFLLYFIVIYFFFIFEVLRESLAVVTFLIAWKYFLENKLTKYFLLCIIAFLFHPSSFFIFLIPIVYKSPIKKFFFLNKYFVLAFIGFTILCVILSTKFFEYIRLLEMSTVDNYAKMYENSKNGSARELGFFNIIAFIIRVFIYPLGAYWIIKNSRNTNKNYLTKLEYLICWFLYFSIMTLFIRIFNRFINYFYPFIIILLSDIVFMPIKYKKYKIKLTFLTWAVCMLPYISLFVLYFFKEAEDGIKNYSKYYPYESIFYQEENEKKNKLLNY